MKLSFVGSGNVSTHLAHAFRDAGHEILSIYSRNEKTGKLLAKACNAEYCKRPDQIDLSSKIVILAIPDDEIHSIAKVLAPTLHEKATTLCHTSGTTDLNTLKQYYSNCGILYPLQSFSINKSVDINKVPFCINGATPRICTLLQSLAETVSSHVVQMDDDVRKVLHISAVFANNFSNYMYVIAEHLCKDTELDFALLRPLIQMTTEKIMEFSPEDMQTGPAKRRDHKVIKEHLEYLKAYPEYRSIYKKISKAIENQKL